MGWVLRSSIVLGVALSFSSASAEPAPKITVHVYNYAQISRETLSRAENEAGRIYRRTGIETEWLDCPLSPEDAVRYPACRLPAGPAGFALRILSRSMGEKLKLGPYTFGFAQFPEGGGFGYVAGVCSHCAEELAKGRDAMHGIILGHLMAHELGHLLLGVRSHSAGGIMHVPWSRKELDLLEQGSLIFTAGEAREIRTQVHNRIRAVLVAVIGYAR